MFSTQHTATGSAIASRSMLHASNLNFRLEDSCVEPVAGYQPTAGIKQDWFPQGAAS